MKRIRRAKSEEVGALVRQEIIKAVFDVDPDVRYATYVTGVRLDPVPTEIPYTDYLAELNKAAPVSPETRQIGDKAND